MAVPEVPELVLGIMFHSAVMGGHQQTPMAR